MKNTKSQVEKMPISIMVDEKQLPDIKDWKVGQEYEMLVKAKMVSSNMDMESEMPMEVGAKPTMNKKPIMSARFHISELESMKDEQKEVNENMFSKEDKMNVLKKKANYDE